MRWALSIAALAALVSCKEPFSRYCDENTECTDPVLSYCDLNGDYNDGTGNICIAPPFDGGVPDADAGVPDAGPGPGVVSLFHPRMGAFTGSVFVDASRRPELVWRPVDGATRYEVQVDDSCAAADFASCEFPSPEIDTATTETSFRPPAVLPVSLTPPVGTRYFWRVRACDDVECSGWSDVWYLRVGRQKNDYDGDGYADLLVGARKMDGSVTDEGAAYIYFGKSTWTDGSTVESADLVISARDARTDGAFGSSTFSVGDVNTDGFADFVVAANPQEIASAESTLYLYLGRATLSSSIGEVIKLTSPGGQVDTLFGVRVSGGCDIDGDGHGDLLVSALHSNPEANEGVIFVYFGQRTWANTIDTADTILDNPRDAADSGYGFVSCESDLNGDGLSDVATAAAFLDNPEFAEGTGFIYFGRAQWPAEVDSADVELDNPLDAVGSTFGLGMDTGADLNGDGYGDLVIPAHEIGNTEADEGNAFVYFGRPSWPSTVETADVVIDNPDDTVGGHMGFDVALGDIDGDGLGDIFTAAKDNDSGKAYIFLGRDEWQPTPQPDVTFINPFDPMTGDFGETMTIPGDIDGDGIEDLAISAFRGSNPESAEGTVFMWLGRVSWMPTGETPSVTFDNPEDEAEAEFGSGLD